MSGAVIERNIERALDGVARPVVRIWLGHALAALQRWEAELDDFPVDDPAPRPRPPATLTCDPADIDALVVEWLRGAPGPPGPTGPAGAPGPTAGHPSTIADKVEQASALVHEADSTGRCVFCGRAWGDAYADGPRVAHVDDETICPARVEAGSGF
jgi:hypothetical protein